MNESTLVPREERKIFGAKDAIDYAEAESKKVSDLDWLARNVHAWPCGSHQSWCYVVTDDNGRKIASSSTLGSPKSTWISKSEWLSHRSEIQMKPDWGEIGESAMYIAQNSHGTWRAFECEPAAYCSTWIAERGLQKYKTKGWQGEVLGDWRDTLEKRPEQTIADICEGVTSENRHEEIFEPFVSVEDAATSKQKAPKGSGNPILGMVLTDLTNRALEGKEKYGEPLLAHNGRNPLWDAYQEALDLAMYLRQAIEEQK